MGHRLPLSAEIALMLGCLLCASPALADLFVSDNSLNSVLQYNQTTGAFTNAFVPGSNTQPGTSGLVNPQGLAFGPDGNLYVSSQGQAPPYGDGVLRYNGSTGQFIDLFAGGNQMHDPRGLTFGPDGNLYVSNYGGGSPPIASSVLEYNGRTGDLIRTFTSGVDMGNPEGLAFGPDGNLYVAEPQSQVIQRFNGTTGDFIDTFASQIFDPTALAFGSDGSLFVSTQIQGIWHYSKSGVYLGSLGAFQIDAYGITFGTDGKLYFSDYEQESVRRYNFATGQFEDFAVSGPANSNSWLVAPTYLAFSPTAVPEPTPLALVTVGGALLGFSLSRNGRLRQSRAPQAL